MFLGDVNGKSGRAAVRDSMTHLEETYKPLFRIVNGENAAGGIGITPDIANELFKLGFDVITLGNHAFRKNEIVSYMASTPNIIRPINYPVGTPGRGHARVSRDGIDLDVVNAIGRIYLEGGDDPFRAMDLFCQNASPHLFVDFHAEVTSEKVAMGWHMDGRATAVVGTHTHVQTADERILPLGTAYLTDAGMCGPENGIIGMSRESVMPKFLSVLPTRFEPANGSGVICGAAVEVDRETGRAASIERIRFET